MREVAHSNINLTNEHVNNATRRTLGYYDS